MSTIVAGIDEAGYGPLIGPLVVAASAFELQAGGSERCLHRLLDDKRAGKSGLPVADSKRLYHGGGSLAALELSALGHVTLARGVLPVNAGGLLEGALDLPRDELAELPWYGQDLAAAPLPVDADPAELRERARTHAERLASRGARCVAMLAAPVPAPRFNRVTSAAGTKAFTLFRATGCLIEALVARFADDELVIHIDRQGGRIHYGDLLQTCFPLATLTTLEERRPESSYRLCFPGRAPVQVHFRVKADDSRAPVAVASALAKLLREVFMRRLCAWFAEQLPGLRPSAGYGSDGQRFVAEVEPLLAARRLPRELLVRCR
ncbi:MAG: hypothetical protein DRQ55_07725 [Planctomycetota bacterium]|nr:MAG: hypothetical protein DRQ55_07725 [Planctomycetota bacterium]